MITLLITPALHFKGCCEEAIRLYEEALGLVMRFVLHYEDADKRDWDVELSDVEKRYVYHAEGDIGPQRIMMADDVNRTFGGTEPPIFLAITYDTAEEVRRAFTLMAEGGTIIYPLHSTTYSSCVGSLVDRYGFRWGMMTEQTER